MSLTQLVRTYRQGRTSIAVGAGIGAVAALGSTLLMPTLFESTTQLFVTTTARTADGQIAPDAGSASDRVRSYARLATSEEVLTQVIADLKLPITTADLATRIRASNEPGTVLIEVRARDEVAANARDIAQKVGEHLPVVVQALETPSDGNDAVVEGPEVTPAPITVRVTDKAVLAHDPVSPNRLLYLGYGLLAGAVLAVLALTWQALFDRRLRSRAEVTERTGIPVLAEIPENATALAGFTEDDGLPAYAEAFRRLRSQLSHAPSGRSLGSVVVTSAVNGDGRTATATNLALALAHGGTDVVLVDADLRSPGVGELLGVGTGPGLSSLLTGAAPLEAALRQWRPGLSLRVISAGPAVANPGDLLGSLRMASLVNALVEHGLTVVIDSPPLTTVADASSLVRVADGALLVARCGRTTADQIGAAVDELRSLGVPLFGIALNRTPAPKGVKAVKVAAPSKPRRTVRGLAARGKATNPVEIPYGSAAGHAAQGFTETAPPPTRAAPPDSLAAAVADLLGQGTGAPVPAGASIGEVSSPEAIAAAISATATAGNAASVLAGTVAAPPLRRRLRSGLHSTCHRPLPSGFRSACRRCRRRRKLHSRHRRATRRLSRTGRRPRNRLVRRARLRCPAGARCAVTGTWWRTSRSRRVVRRLLPMHWRSRNRTRSRRSRCPCPLRPRSGQRRRPWMTGSRPVSTSPGSSSRRAGRAPQAPPPARGPRSPGPRWSRASSRCRCANSTRTRAA